MPTPEYDVITIGGGPAGSTAAALLAQDGYRVLQLERERFPRFKIGESLIPASFDTLKRLGVLDELRRSHFPKKYSVQFFSGDGRASTPFYFSETDPSERSQTWQVLRSEFDALLLDNARRRGAEVRTGVQVREVLFDGDRATGVRVRTDGTEREIGCRVVIDASGQRALVARQLKLRCQDPRLRMAAIFTHFAGAQRDSGIDEGATLILNTRDKDSWFWYIPLPEDRVSVGVVGPIDYLVRGRQGSPQRIFEEELERCPRLEPRLAAARQVLPVMVLNDFSYTSRQVAGDGWVLVGDAFGFLDPIYSSGVLLALRSAELAADAVGDALATGDLSGVRLGGFGPRLRDGMAAFRQLIYAFYNKEFSFGRFLRRHPEHRLAVIRILVGDVFDEDFTPLFDDLGRMIELPGQETTP